MFNFSMHFNLAPFLSYYIISFRPFPFFKILLSHSFFAEHARSLACLSRVQYGVFGVAAMDAVRGTA